jgi:hypothetical protein
MEVFSYNMVDPQSVPLEQLQFPGFEDLVEKIRQSAKKSAAALVERSVQAVGRVWGYRVQGKLKSSYEAL